MSGTAEDAEGAQVLPGEFVAELEAIAGAEGVRQIDHTMLGARLRCEVAPPDGDALGRVLALLGEQKLSAVVRGGGTHDELGNRLGPVALALSTRRLEGIEEFDAQDGVVRVRAGTRVAALRAEVIAEGWDVALDTAGLSASDASTVGGTLAAAAFGARRLGFGAPRDCVLGLDVALASGERTHCGARVVKNVTGYDLQKLYCGSFGSLGVIEAGWLRLRPAPERIASLVAPVEGASDPVGVTLGLAIARRSTARCAAILDARSAAALELPVARAAADLPRSPGFVHLVELAGPSAAVDDDVAWVRARCGAVPAPAGAIEALTSLRTQAWGATPTASPVGSQDVPPDAASGGVVARFSVLPSAVARCVGVLGAHGASLVAHPGLGIVYASWSVQASNRSDAPGRDLDARGIVRDVEHTARDARARFRFERLPIGRRAARGTDVFGHLERGELQLMRTLKQKFDPLRVLNPCRSAGHL